MLRQSPPRTTASRTRRLRVDNHHAPASDEAFQAPISFDQLFALSRDALVVETVPAGRIVRWNPAAERLFGYSTALAIGRPVDLLMPSAIARLHRERVDHYARTGDAHVLAGRVPLPMLAVTSSGNVIRVEYSMAPLEAPGMQARHVLLTFHDDACQEQLDQQTSAATRAESARRLADAQLHRFATVLDESNAELQDLAAEARRTTKRLARLATGNRPIEVARLAQVADCRVARLQRALDDARETSAIQTGAFELDTQRINLVPLVGKVVARVRASAPAHKVNLGVPQGLTAQVDPGRFERVLQDVIERAVRRNPHGCWIDVDLTRPLAGAARLEVRDYGRHLSPRERERLVHQTASDRAWWLNCFIIEQHSGTLSLGWPGEGGVRVIISLPAHRARNTHVPAAAQADAAEASPR